jgi:enolase
METILADFAVGVGASQFMGGGLSSSEYACKYNRLLEIQQDPEGGRIAYVGSRFRKKY